MTCENPICTRNLSLVCRRDWSSLSRSHVVRFGRVAVGITWAVSYCSMTEKLTLATIVCWDRDIRCSVGQNVGNPMRPSVFFWMQCDPNLQQRVRFHSSSRQIVVGRWAEVTSRWQDVERYRNFSPWTVSCRCSWTTELGSFEFLRSNGQRQ